MKTLNTIGLLFLLLFSSISSSCQNTNNTDLTLSQQEKNEMLFMLEEEKLAFDVYNFLNEKWNLRVFENISQSEERHMNAMKGLLQYNNIAFILNKERGVFKNSELQKLYDELVNKGQKSKLDALEVGKLIEEKDIEDLQLAIKNTNDEYSINVYTNLLNASFNHLNAFNRNISKY
ncbi:ferritin-like domain-containing protein [Tenacibaculum larymnensis]|uniref:DUF2202 domain-containing protein n=1 Tax=Tenacibaculum larymnensis TaxID=2878201 RepID=A0A9X4IPW3_9FLAO|nr:DUF2202 domain-containing protein [Tenacibaculum larymnensis]MDE1206427.1 DUF2202 domain-containing protein [Tenacibaculum larymnensis]